MRKRKRRITGRRGLRRVDEGWMYLCMGNCIRGLRVEGAKIANGGIYARLVRAMEKIIYGYD